MSKRPRLVIVSPLDLALAAIDEAFKEEWPEAECINLLDESLYADNDFHGETPQVVRDRIVWLFNYGIDCGADALAFTGSVFNPLIRELRKKVSKPVVTSFEGMIEEGFAAGKRIGVLSSAPQARDVLAADVRTYAAENGVALQLDARCADGAFEALNDRGDRAAHDRLIVAEAARMKDCDAILFAQFSMGLVAAQVPKVPGQVVLTAPRTVVHKLRRVIEGAKAAAAE